MCNGFQTLKIGDFGLTRVESESGSTSTMGTLNYAAPERILLPMLRDKKSDCW